MHRLGLVVLDHCPSDSSSRCPRTGGIQIETDDGSAFASFIPFNEYLHSPPQLIPPSHTPHHSRHAASSGKHVRQIDRQSHRHHGSVQGHRRGFFQFRASRKLTPELLQLEWTKQASLDPNTFVVAVVRNVSTAKLLEPLVAGGHVAVVEADMMRPETFTVRLHRRACKSNSS